MNDYPVFNIVILVALNKRNNLKIEIHSVRNTPTFCYISMFSLSSSCMTFLTLVGLTLQDSFNGGDNFKV